MQQADITLVTSRQNTQSMQIEHMKKEDREYVVSRQNMCSKQKEYIEKGKNKEYMKYCM